jgi:hypothetical protein
MTTLVDPNELLMTGENSFIRLSLDGGATMSDRFSHWRVLWCPAGTGHALFAQTTAFDKQVRIYSDNVAVARWLQRTIETLLHPPFADPGLPVLAAEFSRSGDPRSAAVENVIGDDDLVRLTWWDCIEPFIFHAPPGFNGRPIGVFTTFFPARSCQVEINGAVVPGQPWPEMRADRQSSSASLAWSESWVKPKKP